MVRTQVYIPQDTHKKLISLAAEETKPMAVIIRAFIEQGLETVKLKDNSGKKTLANIAKLQFTGGDEHLSENIDHHLYGASKHD